VITVKVTTEEISALIRNLQRPQPLMQRIADHLVASTRARIRTTKTSPDGTPWRPWAPATADARTADGSAVFGLLFRTGFLYQSIQASVQGTQVTVFSDAPYAKHLQQGTTRMPARPFLGISQGDQDAIMGFVDRYILRTK